ncbi:glutamate-rich protein 3 [Nematolebias whitei]|uniref:glutamate-rich protein 3 n=1 Tax=Nematolebias whitei TaxID=451745 RepID=UPI00189A1EF9|nr:glutamate-rich protein 3 [Nematolebias whitei]
MSHKPGLMPTYNSLTDKHLADYFRNARIRRHLQRAGLLTRSGRVVPDKEYKHKLLQRAHQRHVTECLAQAIFHKVLEMKRLHQTEIKRKLEEFARRERVHRMKVERSKTYKEDTTSLFPRAPTRARDLQEQHSVPEGDQSESSESSTSSRPNTAPGKMQRPVRLKPIHSNSTTASLRRSSIYRVYKSPHEDEQPSNCTMDKKPRRHLTTMEAFHGTSPHYLPAINNFFTPVPPATKKKEGGVKITPSSTIRGRRLRPTTSPSGAEVPPWLRSSVHQTKVCMNMVYFGKTVHLTNDLLDLRDEVKVFQQHCGGENLCVFKGNLLGGETFQFISRRHRGFPFSLTFFLNGLQVERLSSCCEFKHSKRSRLGGRHGHFGFLSAEGASPCYKCIIAMGLDKKPTPPPKKGKEDNAQEQSASSPLDAPERDTERTGDDAASETGPSRDPEAKTQEQTAPGRDKARDDYEEDFEADDEGPVEEETGKGENSPSPFKETEKLNQEENTSETDTDEEEDDTMSRSGSSVSSDDQEESDAESVKDSMKDEKAGQLKEDDQEEAAAPNDQSEEPKSEETAATKVETTCDSAGDSTGMEMPDSSATWSVNKQGGGTSEDKNNEETENETKADDEQDRAKSVQEKLAEAILKESQCSSEPELSDSSTEEEEGPTAAHPKQENEENLFLLSEQEQTVVEETKLEEKATDEEARELEESPGAKEVDVQQPLDNSESNKDDKVNEAEGDERAAEDEVTAERDQPEASGETQLHVDNENMAQDNKTEDSFDLSKASESEALENDEGEKIVVEAVVHTDDMGQRAKSETEDESSAFELNKETDENTEAEATAASETMDIKAESSEEQEALSGGEVPESDAERRQQADSEGNTAAPENEVTAEESSSLPEEAGDCTDEKPANKSEETMKDEGDEDGIKEAAQEQTSETDERKDDSEQEKCEQEEENMEITAEVHENTNEPKSEEEQTHQSSEITGDENMQGAEQINTEEIIGESKEDDRSDKNTTRNYNDTEEAALDPLDEQNKAEDTKNTEEQEKTDEGSESGTKEPEAGGEEKEQTVETSVASAEKDDGAGKSEKDESEDKVTESEHDEKHEERKDVTEREGEEMSEITEGQEKSEDTEEEKIKARVENVAGSEDVCDSEAAGETQTAEGVQNSPQHESDEEKRAGASGSGEGDDDNGDIPLATDSSPDEDEKEAPAKEEADSETAEQAEKERKPEEATEEESAEVTVKSGETAEKQEDNMFGAAPDTDLSESGTKEGDDSVAKHNESAEQNTELETSDTEIKEDLLLDENKGDEETGEEEKGKKADLDHKNKALDLIKNDNNVENISEVALSEDQERASAPVEDDGAMVDPEKAESVSEKNLETRVGTELSAADGENKGTEEASKASDEGVSVLLKPSTQSNVGGDTPEALTNKDNTDLVTSWIQMHQSSRYFETFVEPLEDLQEDVLDVKVSSLDYKETPMELLKSTRMFEDEEKSKDKAQIETGDLDNTQSDQYEEKTEVKDLVPREEDDQSSHGGSVDKDGAEDGPATETHEENTFSKTEVESVSCSLKAESVFENQSVNATNLRSDLSAADLPSKTKELHKSESLDETDNPLLQVTQTAKLSTLKLDDGSKEELQGEGVQPDTFEERFREKGDMLIKQTFSKDHLSTFSVDRALFAHTSYPLLTTSGTDSGQ